MADVRNYDQLVKLVSDGYFAKEIFYRDTQTAVTANGTVSFAGSRRVATITMPSLPSGVTKYRLLGAMGTASINHTLSFFKAISFGSINISTPTFTDGSAWGTQTQLGASVTASSPVLLECTTVLNATPGNLSFTYKNQAGTGGQTSSTLSLGANTVVGSMGYMQLAAGDYGCQDITAATRTAGTTPTGVIKFWGVQPIGKVQIAGGSSTIPGYLNPITSSFNMIELGAGDTVLVVGSGGTGTGAFTGQIWFAGER